MTRQRSSFSAAVVLFAAISIPAVSGLAPRPGTAARAQGAPRFTLERTLTLPRGNAYAVAFSVDGSRLFARSQYDIIQAWELKSGRVVCDLRSATPVHSFALTPDSRHILTAGETRLGGGEGEIMVWEVATGRRARRWAAHGKRGYSVACRPDGRAFATGGDDDFVRVWALPSCQEIRRLRLPRFLPRMPASAEGLAFYPSGKKLLIWSFGLHVWDLDAGTLKCLEGSQELSKEQTVITCPWPAVSPDGRWVAACVRRTPVARIPPGQHWPAPIHDKYVLRVWDAATGKAFADFPREGQESVTFDPTGRYLVSAEGDTSFGDASFRLSQDVVRFWDLGRKRCTFSWHVPKGGVLVAFSPAGDRLATAHMDGTIRVWRYRPASGR